MSNHTQRIRTSHTQGECQSICMVICIREESTFGLKPCHHLPHAKPARLAGPQVLRPLQIVSLKVPETPGEQERGVGEALYPSVAGSGSSVYAQRETWLEFG